MKTGPNQKMLNMLNQDHKMGGLQRFRDAFNVLN
ncbi:MAG: hypothetical protein JWM42_2529 [Burkholderia sp.]|nr:hypothetical protein [Burkholderia sp.]